MVIVRSGRWLYADAVEKPVDIVGLPFDFWYELGKADEQLEPSEMPRPLGEDSLLFYVRFVRGQTKDERFATSASVRARASGGRRSEVKEEVRGGDASDRGT